MNKNMILIILFISNFFLFFVNPLIMISDENSNNNIVENVPPMIIGEKEAPIKIVEYASFTCPHCATFHLEVIPKLKKEYIETGKVLLEYREVYFDGPGLWAGLLARCNGLEKYFPMINLIYKKQKEWASGNRNDIIQGLLSIGRQSGLTDTKSMQCMENNTLAEKLVSKFKKNANDDGISSTPSLLINGKLMKNMPYKELKKIIDKNLNQ